MDPFDVKKALPKLDSNEWKKAMEKELKSFTENKAWDLVDPVQEGIIVDNKRVFKRKIDFARNVCYRAKLVTIPVQIMCLNC